MPIYIARNYDGYVEDVVLAKNEKFAQVYWQGKGIIANSVRTLKESDLEKHITGVIPVVTTKVIKISSGSGMGLHNKKIVTIKKG